jgi:hypothetical protein
VAGVLLPYNRKWKVDDKGRRYNDAHRVDYEARAIINEILDAGPQSPVGAVGNRVGQSNAPFCGHHPRGETVIPPARIRGKQNR